LVTYNTKSRLTEMTYPRISARQNGRNQCFEADYRYNGVCRC